MAERRAPLRKLLIALASLVAGYLVGAFGGGVLVDALSANTHDRAVEAAMTGAFLTGPLGAVIGLIEALGLARKNL
jgi:lipid-binding SYLF domain-containing protein